MSSPFQVSSFYSNDDSEEQHEDPLGRIIGGQRRRERFTVLAGLAQGSFGSVYKVKDNQMGGKIVALKVEEKSCQLQREFDVLGRLKGFCGFVEAFYFGYRGLNKAVMSMTLLGDDLETKFLQCGRRFSEPTILNIAAQMLDRLEVLHNELCLVHRDLKPENMAVGATDEDVVYLIDFGLSKEYEDGGGRRLPYDPAAKKSLIGTARYASLSSHLGKNQGPRDDLESLAYILLYFAKGGELKWMGKKGATKQDRHNQILLEKAHFNRAEECVGIPAGKQIQEYLDYVDNMSHNSEAPYDYLRSIFECQLKMNEGQRPFDWID